MFSLRVESGDALLFDGSVPHGQGAIPDKIETWTIFATLHEPGTFREGFPDMTLNQSNSIYGALTKEGHSWDLESLDYFRELSFDRCDAPASDTGVQICLRSLQGTRRVGSDVGVL